MILHKLFNLMVLHKVSEHVAEPMKAFSYSCIGWLATASISMDWILKGRDVLSLISMAALAVLNVLILCNYIHHRFFKKKKRNG